MSKGTLKTIAAIVVVLVWLGLWAAGLWELVGNAVLWLGLAGFLWLAVAIVAEQVRRRRRFRQQGYLVTEDSERRFIYRERFEDGIRELRLPGEWVENGHMVYCRVSQEVWAAMVPDWARERRLEIEDRIRENRFYRPEEF